MESRFCYFKLACKQDLLSVALNAMLQPVMGLHTGWTGRSLGRQAKILQLGGYAPDLEQAAEEGGLVLDVTQAVAGVDHVEAVRPQVRREAVFDLEGHPAGRIMQHKCGNHWPS